MYKKAQQEMVGFVLIVIVVVIALLVFMIFKISQPAKVYESISVDNILQGVMHTSSQCKVSQKSGYQKIEDLFEDCYDNKRCMNTDSMVCDELNVTLKQIFDEILFTDNQVSAYELNTKYNYEEDSQDQFTIINGNCSSKVYGSNPYIISLGNDGDISVDLKLCMAN